MGGPLRVALFVEGANFTDLRGREELSSLWRTLCKKCDVVVPCAVVGFSKSQLRKMERNSTIVESGPPPLHFLVAQHYDLEPFDRAIIAFDAFPENQEVVPKGCQHEEIDFVLRHFADASGFLPPQIIEAAAQLRRHYGTPAERREARSTGALELLYMRPNFEALLVCDEPTVKRALLGHGEKAPSKWPAFNTHDRNPDQRSLPAAVDCASRAVRAKVRGKFSENKHGWAEYIVRHATAQSRMMNHPIAQRLRSIGAG